MKSSASRRAIGPLLVWGLLASGLPAVAADEYVAATTVDPAVPLDELALLLLPLTRGELEVEAAAWLALVKAKVHEISDAAIAAKYKRLEIAKAAEAADAARQAQAAAEEAERVRQAAAAGDREARETAVEASEEAEQAVEEALAAVEEAVEAEERVEEHEGAQEVTEEALAEVVEEGVAPAAVEIEDQTVRQARSADAGTLEEVAEAVEEAAEAKVEVREQIFERVTELRNERIALIDRARLVLEKLEEKGGDVDQQASYLAAVSGVEIDVTDTTATWAALVGWAKAPEGGIRWMRNLLRFAAVLAAAWLLAALLGLLADKAVRMSDRVSVLTRRFVHRTVRRVILAVGFVVALATLEINVGPVLAVIGAAGFILAFALQDSLGNLASGLMIMVFRPFDVADVVQVAGVKGKVDSMNLVSTSIKTFDNQVVVVPNRKIWGDVITNLTGSDRRRVDLSFRIDKTADADAALEILEKLVAEHPKVLEEPPPLVRIDQLGDNSVTLICRPWTRTQDYNPVRWDITRSVKEQFDHSGISAPLKRELLVDGSNPAA